MVYSPLCIRMTRFLISQADHHANFVTWHETAKKCGAKIQVLPILDNWLIDENALIAALNEKTKLVALNFVSNVTGTEQHIQHLIHLIRQHSNALVLVDAAQAISHIQIDLQALDADFIAFSAHKIYGPKRHWRIKRKIKLTFPATTAFLRWKND